ncbi:hypothetical protein BDFG_05242 [Blastomyces dermatitidis ATCC 26199]|nr:hypothetical protein BDFG_05242 [Blastomyces dermatitidis ATCC 26199]
MNKLISRRNDTSLQSTVTITAAAREAEEEEEDVTIRAVLLWLIDIAASACNLAFMAVMKAVITSQRHLFTRKYQNKLFIILQE